MLRRVHVVDPWADRTVRDRLSWYYAVLRDLKPAKFLVCKLVPCEQDPRLMTDAQLWQEHDHLRPELSKTKAEFEQNGISLERFEKPEFSFLDLKCELANRILRKCIFCEWRCRVDRVKYERKGACHLNSMARVATFFRHFGEEPPLVDRKGSGTIFFASCTFRCAFCLHPTTQILTQYGPAPIAGIFARATRRSRKSEGTIAWPSNLLTIDHMGRTARIRKVFRHRYSGKMMVIKPYFLPALIATPDHEIYATPKPGVVPAGKFGASELRKGWFLALPKPNSFEPNDEFELDEVLVTKPLVDRESAKLASMKTKKILRLRRRRATSAQIADSMGRLAHPRNVFAQNVPKFRGTHRLYHEDGNHFYVPLHGVTECHYTGPVFNLETAEESHSYLANFLSVGNCQNWDISQDPDAGAPVSPGNLSLIIKSLRSEGAANINFVGGEPTPNLHVILQSLNLTTVNVPILWNSNMYLTPEAMQILADIVDIWLPDFKWGNDRCAVKYSRIVRYFEVTSRNHAMAYQNGDMIIRHLVMPGHVECCTKPILCWIAENCPRALVNVMSQYRAEHLVLREPGKFAEIARRPTMQEVQEARDYADELGIVWDPVS